MPGVRAGREATLWTHPFERPPDPERPLRGRGVVCGATGKVVCPLPIARQNGVSRVDLLLLAEWGSAGGCPIADLDGDGTVGASDLAILLASWSV